jgi:hypothetical protein
MLSARARRVRARPDADARRLVARGRNAGKAAVRVATNAGACAPDGSRPSTTQRRSTMKPTKIAAAVAMGLALGFGQVALAQKNMDNVMKMDSDKDGMISKTEAMQMFEQKFDAMMKQKGVQKLSAKDVQAIIDDIAKTYGTGN